jgi:uncharacterized protein YcfJ
MSRKRQNRMLAVIAALALPLSTPIHAQSEADCAARAERAARGGPTVVGSAAVGAGGGALVGAIVGGRRSVARGAAAGALVGGATRAVVKNSDYRRVYDDCMYHRH